MLERLISGRVKISPTNHIDVQIWIYHWLTIAWGDVIKSRGVVQLDIRLLWYGRNSVLLLYYPCCHQQTQIKTPCYPHHVIFLTSSCFTEIFHQSKIWGPVAISAATFFLIFQPFPFWKKVDNVRKLHSTALYSTTSQPTTPSINWFIASNLFVWNIVSLLRDQPVFFSSPTVVGLKKSTNGDTRFCFSFPKWPRG